MWKNLLSMSIKCSFEVLGAMSKYIAIVVQPTVASVKTQDPFQWSWAWPNSNSMVIEETIGGRSLLVMANDALR